MPQALGTALPACLPLSAHQPRLPISWIYICVVAVLTLTTTMACCNAAVTSTRSQAARGSRHVAQPVLSTAFSLLSASKAIVGHFPRCSPASTWMHVVGTIHHPPALGSHWVIQKATLSAIRNKHVPC